MGQVATARFTGFWVVGHNMTVGVVDPVRERFDEIGRFRVSTEDWVSDGLTIKPLHERPSVTFDVLLFDSPEADTVDAELKWEVDRNGWKQPKVRLVKTGRDSLDQKTWPKVPAKEPRSASLEQEIMNRKPVSRWESCKVVVYHRAEKVREDLEAALDGVRPVTLQRVIALDLLVRYEAAICGVIWRDYADDRLDASHKGFVEWMSGQQAATVVEVRGEEVFDAEWARQMSGKPRVMRDALSVLRHFYYENEALDDGSV